MSEIIHNEPAPTLDDVWRLIRETDRQLREQAQQAERRAQEADRRFQETELFLKAHLKAQSLETERRAQEAERRDQEAERRLQETELFLKAQSLEAERRAQEAELRPKAERRTQEAERRTQETERLLREQSQAADRRFQETERYLNRISTETDKKIGKLTNRLGEFVEGLVAPALIGVFQARGIAVNGLSRDISRRNPQLNLATQIDLFVMNGDCCILVEVKSKLSVDDVNEHLQRMGKFRSLFPEYADKKAYGAVAAMVTPDEVARYAYHKGFFVLAQQGETVAIMNDANFQPLAW